MLPSAPVSSYPTFSPLPQTSRGGYFLLRYSALTNSFPLGNMVLCVARTFLFSAQTEKRQAGLLLCKGTAKSVSYQAIIFWTPALSLKS